MPDKVVDQMRQCLDWLCGRPEAKPLTQVELIEMITGALQRLDPTPGSPSPIWLTAPTKRDPEQALNLSVVQLMAIFRDHYGVDERAMKRVINFLHTTGIETIREVKRLEH
jgi:hypothetical protein